MTEELWKIVGTWDAARWGFIGTMVGAVVGASASIAATLITSWNTSRLQSNESKAARAEQHRIFQHATLEALQGPLDELLRNAYRVCADGREHVGFEQLIREWSLGFSDTERTVERLTQRVADDHLRGQLMSILQTATIAVRTQGTDESMRRCNELSSSVRTVQGSIGAALRRTY